MNIPQFSVKKPVTVSMVILIIVVLGIIALTKLGLDMMPDITYPAVTVLTSYEGSSPEDIEELITEPIEEAVATVKGIKKVNSISMEGLSAVIAEFEWGTNIDKGAQDIRDIIDMMMEFLPEDVSRPQVIKFDISMMPIAVYGITGGENTYKLRKWVDDNLKNQLEQVDGVASVFLFGGEEKEIKVEVEKRKIFAFKLLLTQIADSISSSNINQPGGYLTKDYVEFLARTLSKYKNIDDIKNTMAGFYNGKPIYVKDVATVREAFKEKRSASRTMAKPGVMIVLNKESGANIVLVSNRIEKKLKKIEKFLPPDFKIYDIFNQANIIKRILKVTFGNAVVGGLLAVVILYVFLRAIAPTLTIALAIPTSLIATLIPIYFLGYTLNFVILIGIALGVGMLVDSSIVVIENIYRYVSLGFEPKEAAVKGASEVIGAITASTLTTVVVFIPLFFAEGITGRIFRQMATTISFALFASLFISITIVPMLASKIFKLGDIPPSYKNTEENKKKLLIVLKHKYKDVILWSIKHKYRVLAYSIGTFLLSCVLFLFIGKEFFPKIDNNMLIFFARLPVGTPLKDADSLARQIEKIILKIPELDTFSTIIGVERGGKADAAFGSGPQGPNEVEFFIKLISKTKRKRSSRNIANFIRENLPDVKGVKYEFLDLGSMMLQGGAQQKPVSIKFFGDDLETLVKITQTSRNIIEKIPGVADVESSYKPGKPEYQLKLDRFRLASFGISPVVAAAQVRCALTGISATRFNRKGDEIEVTVILKEDQRQRIEDILNLPVSYRAGKPIYLRDVSHLIQEKGPVKLTRENQKRVIEITGNYKGKNLFAVFRLIKKALSEIGYPSGYFYEFGGDIEQMRDMFVSLAEIVILAILLVYMVMASQFESFVHPIAIMITLPLSFIGVVLAMIFFGKTVALPSGMGVIILVGIIVNNAIVMVDFINKRRTAGMSRDEAIVESGLVRLRPIFMTALTTILGMFPMAISHSEGSAIRSQVAVAIIGGMFIGTLLTLVVLPSFYVIVEDFAGKIK
ncbi:MAG: efflux RND transporter permease subunit [Elusimicrobia bacterium]|nr:efflux RND transporter permease subunit [Elusimicrobiota bacterium]